MNYTNFFDNQDICFHVLLFVQDIVDIYHLSKINSSFYWVVKHHVKNMNNIQFAILNLAWTKKWKLIMNPKKTESTLISYTPSYQIFVKNSRIDDKYCAVFDTKNKNLHLYGLKVDSVISWDGENFEFNYLFGDKIKGSITEEGLEKYDNIHNKNFIHSIVFPRGWIFYQDNTKRDGFYSHFLRIHNRLVLRFNFYNSEGARVIKIDSNGVHFLFRVSGYQSENRLIKKYIFDRSFCIFEKFYYGIFDFRKFSFVARSDYKIVDNLIYLTDPDDCDILSSTKKGVTKYFLKSSLHSSLIPLKRKCKVPKYIGAIEIFSNSVNP
jgi:hypothetical protein